MTARDASAAPVDFSTWDRLTLERFAREAADENRELRADLRAALDAYRQAVATNLQTTQAA
jgi:hypothetical protein